MKYIREKNKKEMEKTNIESVAQEIQDLYFEAGARVSRRTWEKTVQILSEQYRCVSREGAKHY